MRMILMNRRTSIAAALAIPLALSLAACSSDASDSSDGSGEGTTTVLTSFYPLQFLAERVGGDVVDVSTLAPAGTEPHDLELAPAQVTRMPQADLVLYLSGFQPAVDEAVAQTGANALDIAPAVHLSDHGDSDHADDADDDHAEEEGHTVDDGHDHGSLDPHFWLDPTRMADAADALAAALAQADPANAATFEANAAELRTELLGLDEEFRTGLASCERPVIVAAHEAYGYLAEAYGLEQVGVSGLDPEAEPSPARLREVSAVVTAEGVTTIFTESLVNPRVAEVLAADLGVTTAVLDPLETLTDTSAGEDYLGVMQSNLAALRTGLGCA